MAKITHVGLHRNGYDGRTRLSFLLNIVDCESGKQHAGFAFDCFFFYFAFENVEKVVNLGKLRVFMHSLLEHVSSARFFRMLGFAAFRLSRNFFQL